MAVVCGIDPGTASTGYAVLDDSTDPPSLVAIGVVRTNAGQSCGARLEAIYRELVRIFSAYKPEAVAIEQLFFARNAKTALAVGQARGVALLAAEVCGARIFEYTPMQVKQAVTSYGRADKVQVQEMVRVLLGLQTAPKPDDAADAAAVALCHRLFQQTLSRVGAAERG